MLMSAIVVEAGSFVDLAGGVQLPVNVAPPHTVNGWGRGMGNTAAGEGAFLTIGTSHRLCLQPPLSLMWVGSRDGTPDDFADLFGVILDANPYFCYGLGFETSPSTRMKFAYNDSGSSYYNAQTTAALPAGPQVAVGVLPRGNGSALYANGTVATGNTCNVIGYTSTAIFIIAGSNLLGRATRATTNFGAVWNRELSAGEIVQLSADPFTFLRR
jgi:hypothetical protein